MKTQVEKPSDTPAPGTYKIERSNTIILYDRSPKYTFGMRPDTDKPSDTPGKYPLIPFVAESEQENIFEASSYQMAYSCRISEGETFILTTTRRNERISK